MSGSDLWLAEFNIARLKAPLDSPIMQEFVEFLAPVNQFAEHSPGFVWRLTAADGSASSYLPSPYADPLVITNLSVWNDIESLQAFTYHTVHSYFLRGRKKWFAQMAGHQVVLWWLPRAQFPTMDEAQQRLAALDAHGPSPDVFTPQALFDRDRQPLRRTTTKAPTL